MASEVEPASVSVRFRCSGNLAEVVKPWCTVEANVLATASPWRTFRWYKGQRHYSGSFWAATETDLVIYESRLELARLLFAISMHRCGISWPSRSCCEPKSTETYAATSRTTCFSLTLDRSWWTSSRAIAFARPENAFTFAWTKRAVESRGWRYEVWSEPHPAELENVRFLAGFRTRRVTVRKISDRENRDAR
jgi:hypothetical protein